MVKQSIAPSRRSKNRGLLAKATENYFKSLSPAAASEENAIAHSPPDSTVIGLNAALED